jgi:hypothetical protein
MAISFPGSKSNGQKFTAGNKSWTWNGASWKGSTTTGGDATTFDSLDSSQFLRSDADDTATGSYSFSHSYNEFGNSTGSVSNDGSWNARLNLAGSSHARLDVKSVSDGIITSMYSHSGHNAGKIGTYSNHQLKFIINGSDKATLSTAGSLSTTSQGTLWGASNDGSGSGLDADTVDGIQGSSFLRSDADDMTSGKLTIDSTGQLYVRYNNSDLYRAGLDWNVLQLGNNGQNKVVAGHNATGGYFQFYVNNTSDVAGGAATNGISAMTIDAAGDVGIGITSPSQKLHVSGNILATGNVTATAFIGDGSQLTGISGAAEAEAFATYSSAPSVPAAGGVYYNTTEDKAYISNGTLWAPFTNSPPEPTSGTRSLSGTNGSSFSHNLDTDFTDDQPITNASYTHNSGSLPPGVSISGNLLSGTPTSTGTYTFGISGRDALGAEGTDKSYSFVVNALPFAGSGGSVSYSGGYTYHTFTSSGNFTVSGEVSKTVDYLIVAGGGGGGTDRYQDRSAGGGGAGGMLTGSRSTGSGTYSAVIGGGGSGDVNGTAGGNGSNSSLSSFGSTAIGGGGGAGHTTSQNYAGKSGGSGGGGTHDNSAGPPGSGTSGQGNAGAYSNNTQGGAGAQWVNGSYYAGGGAGSRSGYVGGGGGGKSTSGTSGSSNGGIGGGGNSGSSTGVVTGGAGSSNTGGGGGAARETTAGAGGSGVVIVRYQT